MNRFKEGRRAASWILTLVLALGAAVALPAQERAASVAVTVKATGEVFHTAAADGREEALLTGARLGDGDQVRTGPEGRAVLVFTDDKSQLKLTPLTRVTLHANRQAGRTDKEVEMSAGTLWSKVTRQQGEFRIATPTSVASVKGTAWWTRAREDGTEIIAEEGIVSLMSKTTGETLDVVMGQTGRSDGRSTSVAPTTAEDQIGLERGELRRVTVPISDGDAQRTLIIEFYE
ncbi:MAG: FecR family protein [bacterium]|jgi:hypothetical protein|nr:FecR family protein [bacterium]